MWKQEQMSSFKDFLGWHNNKDVVLSLKAMQKLADFYHDKDIDMLKLGFTLPNLSKICLHKSTDANFNPFTVGDKHQLEKNQEHVVGGPSIVFTRKAVVDETFLRKSTNICKYIVGIDARQLYPYSICHPYRPVLIRVGISIQQPVDSPLDKTRPVALKIWSCLIFNVQDLIVKLRASTLQADRKKFSPPVLMGFVLIAKLCLKQWVAFTTSVPVKSCILLSLKRIFNVEPRRESSMHWDDTIYKRKATRVWKCESTNGGDCTKQPILLTNISENTFLTGVHLQLSNF